MIRLKSSIFSAILGDLFNFSFNRNQVNLFTMLSRNIRRTAVEAQWHHFYLPPDFLLPLRARLSTISHSTDPEPLNTDIYNPKLSPESQTLPRQPPRTSFSFQATSTDSPPSQSRPFSSSIRTLLPLLRAQPSHYITAHIHARPYLLTVGAKFRLPFHMAQPGFSDWKQGLYYAGDAISRRQTFRMSRCGDGDRVRADAVFEEDREEEETCQDGKE